MKFLTEFKTFDEIKETEKMVMFPIFFNTNKCGVWIPKKCLYESNNARDKHRNYLYLNKNFSFNVWDFDNEISHKITAKQLIECVCAENIEKVLIELERGK